MKGSDWLKAIESFGTDRERVMAAVLDAVDNGLRVDWQMKEVTAGDIVLRVACDYFAIGDDTDFVRVPLDGPTAQIIADDLGFVLPTRKMVDLVWGQADTTLGPRPMTPEQGFPRDADMFDVRRLPIHNEWIEEQLHDELACRRPAGLVAGHKKDVVITNRLAVKPGSVAIYGWHRSNGEPIQGLSTRHVATYWDYSHGARFFDKVCKVGGVEMPIAEVLQHRQLYSRLSDEGPMSVLRYPLPDERPPDTEPSPASADFEVRPPTIRRGGRGPLVERVQKAIGATADGVFGPLTERKVRIFQTVHGLVSDGIVGQKTWRTIERVEKTSTTLEIDAGVDLDEHVEAIVSTEIAPVADADIEFVQAKNYRRISGERQIDLIVIHTMEAAEHPGTAENVAAWFAGPSAPRASAHFNIDADSIVQSVKVNDVAWAAPGANHNGVHFEHAGYARQTDEQWSDAYSRQMLERSAALCAMLCKKHDVPVEFVDADGLRAGKRGVTYHAEVSRAFRKSSHTDPGKSFPKGRYLALVRAAMGA